MQLRNLTQYTQRSYIHYVAGYARDFSQSPEKFGAEAIDRTCFICSTNGNSLRKA
jgi:hypothetical protein